MTTRNAITVPVRITIEVDDGDGVAVDAALDHARSVVRSRIENLERVKGRSEYGNGLLTGLVLAERVLDGEDGE